MIDAEKIWLEEAQKVLAKEANEKAFAEICASSAQKMEALLKKAAQEEGWPDLGEFKVQTKAALGENGDFELQGFKLERKQGQKELDKYWPDFESDSVFTVRGSMGVWGRFLAKRAFSKGDAEGLAQRAGEAFINRMRRVSEERRERSAQKAEREESRRREDEAQRKMGLGGK